MYDAVLGRFFALDPLAEKYSSQSPYVYAANNPIYYIDYLGMATEGPDYDKTDKGEKEEKEKKKTTRILIIKSNYTYNKDGSHTIETTKEWVTTEKVGRKMVHSSVKVKLVSTIYPAEDGADNEISTTKTTTSNKTTYQICGGRWLRTFKKVSSEDNNNGNDGTINLNKDQIDEAYHKSGVDGLTTFLTNEGQGSTPLQGSTQFNTYRDGVLGAVGLKLPFKYAVSWYIGQFIGSQIRNNGNVYKGKTRKIYDIFKKNEDG